MPMTGLLVVHQAGDLGCTRAVRMVPIAVEDEGIPKQRPDTCVMRRKRSRRTMNRNSNTKSCRRHASPANTCRRIGLWTAVLLLMHSRTQTYCCAWTSPHHSKRRPTTTRRWITSSSTPASPYPPRRDTTSTNGNSSSSSSSNRRYNYEGLSKFHRSILSRNNDRQRLVTGKYPVTVCVTENPTKKWLHQLRGDSSQALLTELLVNGTAIDRSAASMDRFQWLDGDEKQDLWDLYSMVSVELVAEIRMERPGYLHVLPASTAGASAAAVRRVGTQVRGYWKRTRALAALNKWNDVTGTATAVTTTTTVDANDDGEHKDRLWVTGFSLAGRQGLLKSVDATADESDQVDRIQSVNDRTAQAMLWPNEVHAVPANLFSSRSSTAATADTTATTAATTATTATMGAETTASLPNHSEYQDALLVADGFLVPGKDRGGVYVVKNPGHPQMEWTVSLTATPGKSERWFYHRAVWVDLTGDGRQSILTARAKVSTSLGSSTAGMGSSNNSRSDAVNAGVTRGITKRGELLWLEMPEPHSFDTKTGTPLESDGTVFDPFSARHLPWEAHVLDEGPDVMFSVADLDPEDDTIEVISSQFFAKQVALHSIKKGPQPRVTFERTIDNRCGSAFSSVLADLDGDQSHSSSERYMIDSGSTTGSIGFKNSFSHLLVTTHECSYTEDSVSNNGEASHIKGGATSSDGGSLFAYRVPEGKDAWKTEPWIRSTVATGFKVNGHLNNVINPGAPGFAYTFHAKKKDMGTRKQPMIAVAGDCAESAYIFRPERLDPEDGAEPFIDPSTRYKLMVEIQCGATVGSIGIGYDHFDSIDDNGYAKLYIPCYEKDKVLVFGLGSGEDEDGW